MRLTLRTLVAWLDDTLPPSEVRQIGQQVAESPFAQELVERIHKVTRRRRLAIPTSTGADGTDPNLVASYLDNQLTPEQVADFEKRCLTSDVHLAEVASVHQILSLIGQKAKVPSDSRQRMYHLVKGRETQNVDADRVFYPPADEEVAPVPPWTLPELPRRSALERYGPWAAAALLLVLLVWSARSLAPDGRPNQELAARELAVPANPAPTVAASAPSKAVEASRPAERADVADAESDTAELPAAKEPDAAPTTPAPVADVEKPAAKPAETATIGAVGKEGILLRWDAPTRGWERLQPGTALRGDDLIIGMPPFRNEIPFDAVRVTLIGDALVRLRQPVAGEAARFELLGGHIVLRARNDASIGVVFRGKAVTLKLSAGVPAGLEWLSARAYGDTESKAATLKVFLPAGQLRLAAGRSVQMLDGPKTIEFRPPDVFLNQEDGTPPGSEWVTETKPDSVQEEAGKQFASYFTPDRKPITALVQALEDDQVRVRWFAVFGLGAMAEGDGDIEPLMHTLAGQDSEARRAAIIVLRQYAARGADEDQNLKKTLARFEPSWSGIVEKLLAGYSSEEAKQESTYRKLIDLLKHRDAAVRQLALDNLLMLSGRDAQGYDPDKPEGAGLKAWQDLLQNGELAPRPAETKKDRAKEKDAPRKKAASSQ
jgi:hypothetical protein